MRHADVVHNVVLLTRKVETGLIDEGLGVEFAYWNW